MVNGLMKSFNKNGPAVKLGFGVFFVLFVLAVIGGLKLIESKTEVRAESWHEERYISQDVFRQFESGLLRELNQIHTELQEIRRLIESN